jgi:hypothetical protein
MCGATLGTVMGVVVASQTQLRIVKGKRTHRVSGCHAG